MPPLYQHRAWLTSAWALLLVNCFAAANDQVDILMLGVLKGSQAVSLYSAADRIAGFTSFPLMVGNMVLASVFAALYASGQRARLQSLVTKSARWILLIATVFAALLVLFGQWLLTLFGSGFVQSYSSLCILCFGQWVNAAAGSVALLLSMTGHERDLARLFGLIMVVNIALNALLIPRWYVEGAACAAAMTLVLWNMSLAWLVTRRLGLQTTALG